jgi:hypothetical protein
MIHSSASLTFAVCALAFLAGFGLRDALERLHDPAREIPLPVGTDLIADEGERTDCQNTGVPEPPALDGLLSNAESMAAITPGPIAPVGPVTFTPSNGGAS